MWLWRGAAGIALAVVLVTQAVPRYPEVEQISFLFWEKMRSQNEQFINILVNEPIVDFNNEKAPWKLQKPEKPKLLRAWIDSIHES